MKHILLLTDFTSKSENSHHYACMLFTGVSCKFTFLSVQKLWHYTIDDLMVATYYGIEEALYSIISKTHPEVIKQDGEVYGFFLHDKVKELAFDNL